MSDNIERGEVSQEDAPDYDKLFELKMIQDQRSHKKRTLFLVGICLLIFGLWLYTIFFDSV